MGSIFSFHCNKCGYHGGFKIGIGFSYERILNEIKEDILNGKYGENKRKIYLDNPDAKLECGNTLFRCPDCGNLYNGFRWYLYKPDLSHPITSYNSYGRKCVKYPEIKLIENEKICGKCGMIMKEIDIGWPEKSNIPCPVCGERLVFTGEDLYD